MARFKGGSGSRSLVGDRREVRIPTVAGATRRRRRRPGMSFSIIAIFVCILLE